MRLAEVLQLVTHAAGNALRAAQIPNRGARLTILVYRFDDHGACEIEHSVLGADPGQMEEETRLLATVLESAAENARKNYEQIRVHVQGGH